MSVTLINADVIAGLRTLADASVNCVVTSPPYWNLRDYGVAGQLGLEPTPDAYVAKLVEVFREIRRVLRDDGTVWICLGDSYAANYGRGGKGNTGASQSRDKRGLPNIKPKDLIGIPWLTAFGLRADGWYLRSDIIYSKPNPMPESCKDRPTKAHEYIFLLSKSAKYFYDADAIREPHAYGMRGGKFSKKYRDEQLKAQDGSHNIERTINPLGRNKRTVWTVASQPYKGAHFATYPEKLITPCILAGCPIGGMVLDPFMGSGTTGVVSLRHGRNFTGIELSADYVALAEKRIGVVPLTSPLALTA